MSFTRGPLYIRSAVPRTYSKGRQSLVLVQDLSLTHRQTATAIYSVAGSRQREVGASHLVFNVNGTFDGFLLSPFLLWCPDHLKPVIAPG